MAAPAFAPPLRTAFGLRTSLSTQGTTTVIALRGEADLASLPKLRAALACAIADHEGAIVIDLSETTFIDTGTVRAVGRAAKFLADRSRTLVVRSPSRLALQMLVLLGLADLVEPNGGSPET